MLYAEEKRLMNHGIGQQLVIQFGIVNPHITKIRKYACLESGTEKADHFPERKVDAARQNGIYQGLIIEGTNINIGNRTLLQEFVIDIDERIQFIQFIIPVNGFAVNPDDDLISEGTAGDRCLGKCGKRKEQNDSTAEKKSVHTAAKIINISANPENEGVDAFFR